MGQLESPIGYPSAIFTFATTHHAMAAEDILREAGVPLEVVPPPRELSAGCGLALEVPLKDAAAARRALVARGAAWDAIHQLGSSGEVTRRIG